jgi:hypothetical protein
MAILLTKEGEVIQFKQNIILALVDAIGQGFIEYISNNHSL